MFPVLLALSLTAAVPASAQVMLQGAVSASAPADPADGTLRRLAPAALKTPGLEAVTARDLVLSGSQGSLRIEGGEKNLRIVRLSMTGELISAPGEACQIDVPEGAVLEPAGRPAGALRFNVALPVCPFTIDVLDGAVLGAGNVCDVPKADCGVNPAGLWGPAGGAIKGDLLPRIERSRRQAEDQVRATFKALLATTKDKTEIKRIAAAQAGFSSRREEVCTQYRREDVHGFCAARLTEARAFALRAEYDRLPAGTIKPKPVARKPAPPKPATLFAPPPGPASTLY